MVAAILFFHKTHRMIIQTVLEFHIDPQLTCSVHYAAICYVLLPPHTQKMTSANKELSVSLHIYILNCIFLLLSIVRQSLL